MSIVSLAEWNRFIEGKPDAHLLQMGEWGELKSAFGWKPVRIIMDPERGAQILLRRLPFGLTLGYLPKPAISDQVFSTGDSFWKEIDSVCKKHRAILLKIEPDTLQAQPAVNDSEFRISSQNIQPPRTVVVNLEASEDQILARMKQKCRYNIGLAAKKGVSVRATDDLGAFYAMIQITGQRDGFGVHSREYYERAYSLFHARGTCEILMAEFEGKPLAALMVFAHGRRAWYVYGASNDQERNRMPTYLLQWEAMRWAKQRGCREYDLWGAPDADESVLESQFESRSDGLWGVYRFKRGFGGEVKRAAQALDRVYQPLLYQLYRWRVAGRESL